MKKQILTILAITLITTMMFGVSAAGTSQSFPMKTADNKYTSSLLGYQSYETVWVPCWGSSCKKTILVDYLSVVPSGSVKPNMDYTLVVNNKESTPKQVVCIKQARSSSSSVKVNGQWVTKGYLSFAVKYAWTNLLSNNKNDKFYLVESNKVNCNTGKITTYNLNDILVSQSL